MSLQVAMSNRTVLKVQETLDLLPPLSSAFLPPSQRGGSFRSFSRGQPPEILTQVKSDLSDAAGEVVSARLAILEPTHTESRNLVPVWSCLFRYKSDPQELSRLITASILPNALEFCHFQLASEGRPGIVAVHQPSPAVIRPYVRLFVRFAGLFETQDTWFSSRFESEWVVLGGEYFDTRILRGDKEPHAILAALASAAAFFDLHRKDLMEEALPLPVARLPWPPPVLKKLRTAEPPLESIKELIALSPTELNDRIRGKKLTESEWQDLQAVLREHYLTMADEDLTR